MYQLGYKRTPLSSEADSERITSTKDIHSYFASHPSQPPSDTETELVVNTYSTAL